MRYSIVRYDRDHNERYYAGQFLLRPGLPHLSPAAIGNRPHFFNSARNAERAAIAHGISGYTLDTVSADYVRKVRENRATYEDRFVWFDGPRFAESFAVERDGRAKFKRKPDAIGVYARESDGTLRLVGETPYARR